jgi:hypothetical protein
MAYGPVDLPLHQQFTQTQLGAPVAPYRGMLFDPHSTSKYKQNTPPPSPGWVNPDIPYKSISIDDYRQRLAAALLNGGK